jgi:hypothetical protein
MLFNLEKITWLEDKIFQPDPRPYLDNARFEGNVYFPSGSGLTLGTHKI